MIDRKKLEKALAEETAAFRAARPVSASLYEQGREHLLYGVPMNWMQMWPGGFPIAVREASGAEVTDVDGHRYTDLCLGYSAAFNGHDPLKAIYAIAGQMEKGSVYTLPSPNAYEAGSRLSQRFGLPVWGFALSATDANRFALRICREITGRNKILVFNGCYHGTVSECFVALEDGASRTRAGNMGPAFDASSTAEVIEFNDFDALERVLATETIACLVMEPVMTNVGIIHPKPGFLEACRELTKKTGTVWIIDEAHTITAGPSGFAGAAGLEPDMLVLGKCIGGGFPVGCYGMTREISERLYSKTRAEFADTSGIGGTMTGSPVAMAAILATLDNYLTEDNFKLAIGMAEEFVAGIDRVIARRGLPFSTNRVGARAEYVFSEALAANAAESAAKTDHELYEYYFIGSLNRGYLMSPYYNIMASVSAVTKMEAIKNHEKIFDELSAAII